MIEKVAEEEMEQKENFFQRHRRKKAEFKEKKKKNPMFFRYSDENIERFKNGKNPLLNLMANNQKGSKIGANAGAILGLAANFNNLSSINNKKRMKGLGLTYASSLAGTLSGGKIEEMLKKRKKAQEEKQAFSLIEDMLEK